MALLTELLMILISLTGLLFGLLLAYISPEELKPGKKYFLLLKQVLFVLASLLILYYFYLLNSFIYLLLFLILAVVLFILGLKRGEFYCRILACSKLGWLSTSPILTLKNKFFSLLPYLLFLPSYFLIQNPTFRLILLSLIFLYGFPVGSLLRMKD